jgi:2,5-furandicarboxylate decarboxylase 1
MTSLREFISALEKAGLLKRVREPVDWRFEIGQRSAQSDSPMLFESVKDYPDWQVFTGGLSRLECIALALGVEAGISQSGLVRILRERLAKPSPPVIAEKGAVAETVRVGSEVDLSELPAPWWSEIDAGRYVGTWHVNISKDPETGSRNLGVYRMQVLNRNQTTVSVSPHSHLARHMEKCERAGRPLEMAVPIGVAEAVVVAGSAALPFGVDELEAAGSLMKQPVEVIKCRTVDLEIPANSELALEGRILPGERVKDGPYLDYAGIPSVNRRAYLFEVTAILRRVRPIFRGMAVGRAGAEDHQLFAVLAQLGLLNFHGSQIRQKMQNTLLRAGLFRPFQWTGRIGLLKKRFKGIQEEGSYK